MSFLNISRSFWLGAAYLATAAVSISFTRFNDGVACLWASTATLTAALLRTRMKRWPELLLLCAAASISTTGALGLGWALALPIAILNVGEAVLGAWLFRRLNAEREPLESLGWFYRFVLAIGFGAPLAATVGIWALNRLLGELPDSIVIDFFAGHALGNLTFTPLIMLVSGQAAARKTWQNLKQRRRDVAIFIPLVLASCVLVFTQPQLPLLFLLTVTITMAAMWSGREGAAIAIVMVAIVGGCATASGLGTVPTTIGETGSRMLFFQLFLAATVLTVLPVTAHLEQRRRLLRSLRVSEDRFRLLAEQSTDILMHLTIDGHIQYVSPAVWRIGGHSEHRLIGRNCLELIAPSHIANVRDSYRRVLEAKGEPVFYRYLAHMASGEDRWFESNARAIMNDEGTPEGVLCVVRDVSIQMAWEEKLAIAALTDSPSGLLNRSGFENKVESASASLEPGTNISSIVLFDIDHFKDINDRFGHAAGDEVIRRFAALTRRHLSACDVMARIGGEEFAVFMPGTNMTGAELVCEAIREDVSTTIVRTGGYSVRATVSGGIAIFKPGDLAGSLEQADEALYRAKEAGRNRMALAA